MSGDQQAVIVLKGRIELRPVIEFEPGHYQNATRTRPEMRGDEAPDVWRKYWRDSLADAGIVGLQPVSPGSWHVETTKLVDPHVLRKLLERALRDTGIPGFPASDGDEDGEAQDRVAVLCGGYSLCCDDEVLIEPQCCGDLASLDEWRAAVDAPSNEAQQLWIGHPWLMVARKGGKLIITETTEYDLPENPRTLEVDPGALLVAIGEAERERSLFRDRLRPLVKELLGEGPADEVADLLVGLGEA